MANHHAVKEYLGVLLISAPARCERLGSSYLVLIMLDRAPAPFQKPWIMETLHPLPDVKPEASDLFNSYQIILKPMYTKITIFIIF
jgi:hypothetical protein